MNIVSAAFTAYMQLEKAAETTFIQKIHSFNGDEIDTWVSLWKVKRNEAQKLYQIRKCFLVSKKIHKFFNLITISDRGLKHICFKVFLTQYIFRFSYHRAFWSNSNARRNAALVLAILDTFPAASKMMLQYWLKTDHLASHTLYSVIFVECFFFSIWRFFGETR